MNFPSEKDDWKKFEKNNVTIALIVFYAKKEKIYPAYVPRHNLNREKQVILLMISNGQIRERSEILAKRAKSEGCEWWETLATWAKSNDDDGIIFQ